MLIAIVGPLGSGKTLTMVHLASLKRDVAPSTKVYANLHTTVADITEPAEQLLLRLKFDDICPHSLVLIDELGQIMNAESWFTSTSILLSPVFLKTRKMNVDMIFTSQSYYMLNVNIRRVVDAIIVTEYNRRTKTVRANILDNASIDFVHSSVLRIRATDYFDKYDTNEIITPSPTKILDYLLDRLIEREPSLPDMTEQELRSHLSFEYNLRGSLLHAVVQRLLREE